MESNVKLIGANIDELSNGRKYFLFLMLTGTNNDVRIEEYLRSIAPTFSTSYSRNGVNIDCDSYTNDSYGVALFWYLADSIDGTYNERDFNLSEGASFKRDIESILSDNEYSNKPVLTIVSHNDTKDEAIAKIQAVRKDVVFKNDLYAGKLMGEAIGDIEYFFEVNSTSKPDTSDDIDLDKMTENAEKPIEIIKREKEQIEDQIKSLERSIEGLKIKLKNAEDYLKEQEILANPNSKEEPPKVEDKFIIKDIIEKATHPNATLPKVKTNIQTVTRTEEEVEEKDSKLSQVNKMLDNLDIKVGVTEAEVKEEIKKETPVVNEILNKDEGNTEIPDKQDVTKEILTPTPKKEESTVTEVVDTPTKDEVIYDSTNQGRNIDEYIANLIEKDSDFSGDWEDESELFQIIMSNDDSVRSELTKEEYKSYLDKVTKYSLNKEDRVELPQGIYNLRKAKFDSIGSYNYIND